MSWQKNKALTSKQNAKFLLFSILVRLDEKGHPSRHTANFGFQVPVSSKLAWFSLEADQIPALGPQNMGTWIRKKENRFHILSTLKYQMDMCVVFFWDPQQLWFPFGFPLKPAQKGYPQQKAVL